ncbi:MAG: cation diffusion facilitator family transporter, partial [Bacilli bacterium]
SGELQSPDFSAVWIGLLGSIVMGIVYVYNVRLAKKTNSIGLKAAAKDNLSDALVSIGTVIGIIGTHLGMPFLDSLTAFIVGLIIIKTAWEIFTEASHLLTDGFDPELIQTYKTTISAVTKIQNIIDLRARRQGNLIFVDATIAVDGEMSVHESHEIADTIEKMLHREHDVYFAHVHIEPHYK